MAKKADRPMVIGSYSSQFPRPSYYGLKGGWWNKVEKLTAELADIRERARKVGARRAELDEELRFQERQLEKAQVEAAGYGHEDPDDSGLRVTQAAIDKLEKKRRAFETAAGQVTQELVAMVNEGAPSEVLEDLREKGRQHEERYHELVAQAVEERNQLGQWYALSLWARGVDERGQAPVDNSRSVFRPTPLSPSYDQSQWYDHPLNWDDEEMSDTAITVVS
jgi:hypothetical protein